jgi:lysyl-tRNA synthetase class 2
VSHRIISERVAKLQLLKARGIEPYARKYTVTHTALEVLSSFETMEREQVSISVAGRLVSKRAHGKASFGHVLDRSGRLQVYLKEDVLGPEGYALFELLDVGDIVGVRGPVFRTRTGEITVKVENLALLSKSLRPLPEKWHGLRDVETRYRQRYVDLIVNTDVRRVFAARSKLIAAVRRFLDSRGFVEVETPVLQPVYGGAFARPFVTRHETLDMELYLRIADELYLKRLIVGGLERVYEIGKDFRNEGIDRTHNPEFTQLEAYQAYADYNDVMELVEEMLSEAVATLHGGAKCKFGDYELDFSRPWKRISYFDALKEKLGEDLRKASGEQVRSLCLKLGMDVDAVVTGRKPGKETLGRQAGKSEPGHAMVRGRLLDELFSEKVQPELIQPTFVYDYPKEVSPLAKEKEGEPGIAERFEPIVAGLEVGNAFSEQNDPMEQARQFDLQAQARAGGALEAQPRDLDYVRALEYGMPPTGGLGLGIDRLVMILTDSHSIRDVILFPQLRPETLLEDERDDETGPI